MGWSKEAGARCYTFLGFLSCRWGEETQNVSEQGETSFAEDQTNQSHVPYSTYMSSVNALINYSAGLFCIAVFFKRLSPAPRQVSLLDLNASLLTSSSLLTPSLFSNPPQTLKRKQWQPRCSDHTLTHTLLGWIIALLGGAHHSLASRPPVGAPGQPL